MVRAGRLPRGFVAARQPHFHVAVDLDERADGLLTGATYEIGRRLEQSVDQTPLFTMRWRLE